MASIARRQRLPPAVGPASRDYPAEWKRLTQVAACLGDAVLAMPEIGSELPLVELYEGVEFA
jgi:hypothetical protein